MTEMAPTSDERTWAAAAHLTILLNFFNVLFGVIGCFVVYVLSRSRGPFARDQAAEALNFELTIVLAFAALVAGAIFVIRTDPIWRFVTPPSLIGLGLACVVVWLVSIVMAIVAALRAQSGEPFRYRVAIRFLR